MIDAHVHETLNLKEGLEALSKVEQPYNPLLALTFLDKYHDLESLLKLSKKQRFAIKEITSIHTQTYQEGFRPEQLFMHQKDFCLLANQFNQMLGDEDRELVIYDLDKNLAIRKVCDLAFKGEDIIKLFKIKNRVHIGMIIDELILKVLYQTTPNTYEALKEEAIKIKEQLESSDIHV